MKYLIKLIGLPNILEGRCNLTFLFPTEMGLFDTLPDA